MKFLLKKIIFFFLLVSVSEASSVKFVDINFILNNSISGKNLKQIIEKKNNKIVLELDNIIGCILILLAVLFSQLAPMKRSVNRL